MDEVIVAFMYTSATYNGIVDTTHSICFVNELRSERFMRRSRRFFQRGSVQLFLVNEYVIG